MQKNMTRFRKVVLLLMVAVMLLNCNTIALADPAVGAIQTNSPRNNNEFIDITIPEDGYYYFKVYASYISDEACPPEATIAYRLIDE